MNLQMDQQPFSVRKVTSGPFWSWNCTCLHRNLMEAPSMLLLMKVTFCSGSKRSRLELSDVHVGSDEHILRLHQLTAGPTFKTAAVSEAR